MPQSAKQQPRSELPGRCRGGAALGVGLRRRAVRTSGKLPGSYLNEMATSSEPQAESLTFHD